VYESDAAELSNVRADVSRALVALGVAPESELAATTLLMADELASNAITHACTPFTVAVTSTRRGVCVEVRDGSPAMPVELHRLDSNSGRRPGLALVRQFSAAWGADRDGDGKTVWSVIDRSRLAAAE
jgi:anti-sigma regulatory factor (Ser/Thr protein kinase)